MPATQRYRIETPSGGKYEVDLADGDDIEAVVAEIEASERDTTPPQETEPPAAPGILPTALPQPRRGGVRSEVNLIVAGAAPADPARVELPSGVKPSAAGAGRGVVNPLNATVARADDPFKAKSDAINDAVDRIEMGVSPEKVFESFAKLGIGRDEIVRRGVELGGKAFVTDQRQITARPGALDGEMGKRETGFVEDVANFGKRVGGRMSQAATGVAAQTGLVGADLAAELLAKDQARIEAAAPGEEVQQQLERLGKVTSWGEVPGAIVDNPKGVLMMLAESVAMTAPLLAAGAARIGVGGMAAVAGSTSGGIEYGSALADALADRGVALTDVEQVAKLLKDESFLADTRERAAKRGLAVGAFDALTARLAGRFIEPALEAVRAGKLAGSSATRAVARAWGNELGMQAGGGMAGEQLGQTLTGDHKPLDVALEGLGEMASAPVEALSNARDMRAARAQAPIVPGMAPPAAAAPVRAENMPTSVIPPEVVAAEQAQADAVKAQKAVARSAVPAPGMKASGEESSDGAGAQPLVQASDAAGSPRNATEPSGRYPVSQEAALAAQAGRQQPTQAAPVGEPQTRTTAATDVPGGRNQGPQAGQIERGSILARAKSSASPTSKATDPEPSDRQSSDSQVQASVESAADTRLEQELAEASSKVFATRSHAIVWMANRRVMSKLRPVQDGDAWRVEPLAWERPATTSPETAPPVDNSPPNRKLRRERRAAERAAQAVEQKQLAEPKTSTPTPTQQGPVQVPDSSAQPARDVSPQRVPPREGTASPEGVTAHVEDAAGPAEGAAQHVDPGEAAEPATAAVIDDSVQRAAGKVDRKPAAMRADLLEQIDAAIGKAPDAAEVNEPERLRFDVPGDGEFTVLDTKQRLAEFRKQVEASPGFKNRKSVRKPAGATGLHLGSDSAKAAIKAMLDEGDAQAAVDYARAKGIDIAAVLADDKARLPKIAGIVPTDVHGEAGQGEQQAPPSPSVRAVEGEAAEASAKTTPKGEPISDSDAFADDYMRFEGRMVEQRVLIEDTGQIATLRTDAARALRQLDAKAQALEGGETHEELQQAIDDFVAAGFAPADAADVARGDARVNLQNDRDALVALLREQQPDLFVKTPIADAGEKIGGARKDRWRERGLNLDDLDAMTEAEGASVVNKAAVWKPDYAAMVESGTAPELAALVKGVYDSLAARPRDNTPTGRRRYVAAMRAVREVYGNLSGDAQKAMREAAQSLRDKLGVSAADRAFTTEGRQTLFALYKGRSDPFALGYDDLRRAKKLVAEGFPGKVQPWARKFDILPVGGAGSTEHGVARVVEQSAGIGTPLTAEQVKAGAFSVIGRKSRKTVAIAPSRPDAEAAARAIYERELKSGDDKQTPDRPHLDVLAREGLPEGVERDVTADDFLSEFGFRGVEFGNWTAQDERQKMLNMAFDGLHDLAQLVGVPPKALSLNGTLGMAFGARGGGRFAAHYEPGKLVINLTKLQGGGSLAHEWAHALDHYFGELDRADAYSTAARGASGWHAKGQYIRPLTNLRPEAGEAFNAVMRSLFKKTLPQAEAVRRAELELERVQQRQGDAEAQGDAMALVYRDAVQRAEKALEDARAGKAPGGMATDYSKEAIKLSGKSTNGYWQRPTEMFARAFESYVFDRLMGMGAKSEYLVHGVESERFAGGGYKGNPYPVGDERAAIDDAFRHLFETIKTRETDKGVAMFARRPRGMTAVEVREAVDLLTQRWANAPQIEVIASMAEAPEPVRRANDAQLAGGAKGVPAAFFFDGKVYVVASEMDGPATLAEAVLHEALGHFGLRGTFGEALNGVLGQVVKDRPELVRAKVQAYGLDFDNEADWLAAAEEVLAELAQSEPRASLVQRAIAAIRAWLREFMPALELSDAEIVANIIEPAREFVETGAGNAGGAPAFARAEPPPGQVKSATGNNGNFDPQKPDIRFQRRLGRHSLRAFGRGAQIVETLQDRYNRWKHAVEDIKAQGGLVTDENDFYKAEERYWGRVGTKLDEFNAELHAFVRAVAKDGVTLGQVVLYAYAEHAPERNAYIATKNSKLRGNGSGMTDEEAAQIIAEAKHAGIEPVLQKHTAKVREWIQGTRDVLYDGGLIGTAQYDAWTGMFKAYVPLRGIDTEPESTGPRSGFNITGQEGKEAEGRTSRAKHVLEEVVRDRTRALLRVGKNDVLRSLAQFVLDNPSPDLWSVEVVEDPSDPGLDERGERVIADDAPVAKDYVTLKDAGQEIRVHIKDAELLDQLRAVNREDNPSRPIAALLFANRVLGRLYTSMSPVFTVVNFTRDVQTAAVGLIDEIGFIAAPKLFAKLPRALFEAWQAETGKKSADYQLFAAMGGKTSFFNLRDIDEQAAELEWLVKHGQRSHLNPLKFGASALRLIETINGGIENATRLAAFKVAREAGRSEPQAASIAKNITVNFNRRGTQQLASAWILFFNPAVQGTARIAQSLKHPRVIGTLGVAMMGVAALALRNAGMGEDDDGVSWWDKIPDSVKERNFVIVLPPGSSGGEGVPGSKVGRYVKVPMPYGYNFFAVVANQIVDLWRRAQDPRRGRGVKEATVNAFSALMNSWLPVGSLGQAATAGSDESGAKGLVLMATPDALDPIMQSMLNQSAFGRKMTPDDPRAEKRPDSENYFSGQAGQPFQRAAAALNRVTGGSKYESGLIDLSPATLENLARGYLGAPMSFGLDVVNAMYARHGIERPELDVKRLPFAKQFYAVIDNETDRMTGYARLDKAETLAEPIRRAKKVGDDIDVERLSDQSGSLAELGRAAQQSRRKLSALSKREREIVEGGQGAGDKYALLMENAAQKRQVLQDFSRAYDDALLDAVKAKKKEAKQ